MFPKLQYISQGVTPELQIQHIREALEAGCRWIQLRFKNADPDELKATAEKAKELCNTFQALFIINDDPKLAKMIDADGVHLGLNDLSIAEARAIVGDKIVGGTANTIEDVLQRYREGCEYVGLGPFRFTSTKEKLSPILGLNGYAEIVENLQQHNVAIPIYSIGGILPEDVEDIMRTGVHGIAVSGAITQAKNKLQIVSQLNDALYAAACHSR